MRRSAASLALGAVLTFAGAAAAATPPASAPGASKALVITADHVREAKGVTTWTGHVTVSGEVDPARTALILDGKPSKIVDLATLPPIVRAKLTNQGRGAKRARLDLASRR